MMLPAPGMFVTASRRVTRDETSEMADENSRIYVGTAARRKADDDPHDFAAIEIRYGALIDIHAAAFRRQSWSRRAGEQENNQPYCRNSQFLTRHFCGNVSQI